MGIYGQDAELRLLSKLRAQLDRRTMIDVGAEQGGLAEGMLRAGVEELYAFDPHPDNVSAMRTRFAGDPRMKIYEHAVSETDGSGDLHVSSSPDGTPVPFGHTLLEREDTDEIAWTSTLPVTWRSLESLVNAAEIPARVGILKIDTEGHDLAVVRGMGVLQADVVMVEHWTDLPNSLGVCPWTTQEMVAALRARGFSHFAFIVHRGEFITLKWDNGEVERGAMGNLVFLHDRVLARLLPVVLDCAGLMAEDAVRVGQKYVQAADEFKQAADDRSALIHQLKQAADEFKQAADDRSALVDELKEAVDDRSLRAHELEQVANDRLARMHELEQVANERLALVDELREAAETRLSALEATTARLQVLEEELAALRSAGS